MIDKDFKIIGLTGQSGAGKTTVSNIFANAGVAVVDADAVTHEVLLTEDCKKALLLAFGDKIFDIEGNVVRKNLAQVAFSSKENTEKLNKTVHPFIIKRIKEIFLSLIKKGENAAVIDAPTLFESGISDWCKIIISVVAPKDVRMERIIERDNLTQQQAEQRLNAQHDDSFYTQRSQYVIVNSKNQQQLKADVMAILKELEL